METLPSLVLLRVADYLSPEDTARLSQTCQRLRSILPRFLFIRGKDFLIYGPNWGHWVPELYFDGPVLSSAVKKISSSVSWVDQRYGNRKGEIFVQLMRPVSGREDVMIAEKRELFGIAEHREMHPKSEITEDSIVTLARAGDYYRFMRNAGGGGGHSLTVKDFRVIVTVRTDT